MQTAYLSRRKLLRAVAGGLLASGVGDRVHIGSQTNAWQIDPKKLDSLLAVLRTLRQLEFEGFETSFLNLRSQFEHPEGARKEMEEPARKK